GGERSRSTARGADVSGMSRHADPEAQLIAAQVTAERRVASFREETTWLLASPMLLRGSLVGVLVLQSTERREFSEEDGEALATICAQLVGIVQNARIIDAVGRWQEPTPAEPPA